MERFIRVQPAAEPCAPANWPGRFRLDARFDFIRQGCSRPVAELGSLGGSTRITFMETTGPSIMHAWSDWELPALAVFFISALIALLRSRRWSFLWLVVASVLLLSFHIPAVHGRLAHWSSDMAWSDRVLYELVLHIHAVAVTCVAAFCITQIFRRSHAA